jgi:hypothetical protein
MNNVRPPATQTENNGSDTAARKEKQKHSPSITTSFLTSSMSFSEFDIQEAYTLAAKPYVVEVETHNTFNSKTYAPFDENDDSGSVLSYISSLSDAPMSSDELKWYDETTKVRIPMNIAGDIVHLNTNNEDYSSLESFEADDFKSNHAQQFGDDSTVNNDNLINGSDRLKCSLDDDDDDSVNIFIRQERYTGKRQHQKSQSMVTKRDEEVANANSTSDDVGTSNKFECIPKETLPGLDSSLKLVCVTFMECNIAASVASKVFDESLRMLRPGGLLYVIDKGGCTVQKHPSMLQFLARVRDPTVKHLIYEIETRAILQANGFVHTTLDENNTMSTSDDDWQGDEIVRWIGIKQ